MYNRISTYHHTVDYQLENCTANFTSDECRTVFFQFITFYTKPPGVFLSITPITCLIKIQLKAISCYKSK